MSGIKYSATQYRRNIKHGMNKSEKLLKLLGSVALNKDMIEECLSLINSKLHVRNVIGEIHIFRGAAMLLLFNSRISTKDIDAVIFHLN